MKKKMRIAGPVAIGVILAAVLAVSIYTESFPLGGELKSTTLIKISSYQNFDVQNLASTVEGVVGSNVIVGSMDEGAYFEALIGYDETYANSIRTGLINQGVPENAISIMGLTSSTMAVQLAEIAWAVAGAIIVAGVFLLLYYRRRRVAWSVPIVAIMNMVGTLGIVSILRIPFGVGALIGIFIILIHSISINVALVSKIGSEGFERRAKETVKIGFGVFGYTLVLFGVFAILTGASMVYEILAVALLGTILNFLNTSWFNVEILIKKIQPAKVKYHVSL